ncbi:dipeptidyl aminopeptidases/acylaminoacyl-peptidase [Halosimplex carlsbadense 2-9-1]|uniref:Dipeptidyl aminopeptidases/acylaminoacyl-peptidase n=1 Tax=Halosimplex carlsbadense 2-9-1 TaxID=797114 RepID=M0CW87_9EURY|nr:prolyl oligopeptidase family serine peptidase [Halosimplex carlsbadense]ELZ27465.1 dipeptidyl aminopeptidases/acylaminoacyl-peptidase [Halosimplex carlsbadense 2-9-1]
MSPTAEVDVLEALAGLPTAAHPTASPGGDEIALYYDATGRNELHVLDTETGDLDQWSDGEVPRDARWFLKWGADGDRVFFHRDEDGDEQNDIYAIDRDGAVEPVVEMDGQCMLTSVAEDGSRIVFGSSRDGQMNVYARDLATGETTKLTDYDRAVWGAHLSPDGERIAYATNETDDFDNQDAYIASVEQCSTGSPPPAGGDGSNPRNLELGEVGAECGPADWGPESERLLVSDNTPDLGRAGVYDLAADEVTWLGDGRYDESAVAFVDGERVLASRDREAVTMPVVYDVDSGERRELDLPEGVASTGWSYTSADLGDGRVLVEHTTATRRTELLAYDLDDDSYETLLAADHGPFEPADFADAEYLTVDSDGVPETPQRAVEHDPYDELEIGALLYDSGERPSPLIVNPHGGPMARDAKSFDIYTQVLAMRGYSVLQVNYRGSTGRGREFKERLLDDWGGAEQGDVATAAERVVADRDWIDDDRVVVFGGSYGGYSAYWQSVQYPDLYDAGVAWIGLSDLEDMYENTMPHYRTELMEKYLGTPDENPELYEERSPVTHVENVDAPLLIVHGVNDRRVPVSQARIVREALEDAGYDECTEGDFEYEELGEEGHASSDQAQKLRLFRLLDDFLDRRVGAPAAAEAD